MIRKFALLAAALLVIAPLAWPQCAPPVSCPREAVKSFIGDDMAGVLLRTSRDDIIFNRPYDSKFFLHYDDAVPKAPLLWVIALDYSVDDVSIQGTEAKIFFGFGPYGHVDSALRWHPPDPRVMKYAEMFRLVLSDKRWETTVDGKTVVRPVNPAQWLITDSAPLFVSKETAIRYVTSMRAKTADPLVHKNADATLAILKKLK